jgi:hypothetical protein
MPVNTRSSSLVRTPSPAASESSDMYYDDPAFDSALNSPTNNPNGALDAYDSDASVAMSDTHHTTPTPQPTRVMSPASIIEISEEEFPRLATPIPAATTKTHRKATKKNKGKKRALQGMTLPCD